MSKHIYKKAGAPTFAPTQIGHHYVNITNGDQYLSSGTSSPSDWTLVSSSVDDKVKISPNDTTSGFLNGKLVAGSGISFTENNDGSNETLTIASTITTEDIQDAIGSALTDSSSIDFTYNDVANTFTAAVLPAGVNHNLLQNYVANEHINHSTVSLINGTGISATGLGDLTASRTINIANTSVTAASYGSATQVPSYTVNAQGQLTAASNVTIAIPSTQITDFTEAVQDAVGSALTDTASIDFTYNDASNIISAAVLPAGVNHNLLQNYVANEHINHSTVSIIAGTGLTGGGDITSSRTLNIAATGVTAASYGSATQVPVLTVNAQGQLTSVSNTAIAIPSSQVTDLSESIDDRVAALLVQGSGITLAYNDPSNTLTISSSITQYTNEDAQDAIAASWADTASIDYTYNDAGNSMSAVVLPAGVNHNLLQNYVANEHINHSTVVLNAGTGISSTGLGDITASRTINIANTTVTAGAYGSATQVGTFSVNAQGQLTAASNVTISISSTNVSDFTEAVQDVMGGAIVDSSSVDFQYNDVANTQSAVVLPAGVNHNLLQNYVANEHINHSTVTISAGTGLTGGGDITASRTISMPSVITAGTYGSSTTFPVITVDAQGRVTSVTTNPTDSIWIDAGGLLTWSDETGKDLVIRQAGGSGSAYIRQVSSNGTLASPTATTTGQRLGGNGMYGWNSTGVNGSPSGAMNVYATENHTSTNQGAELAIEIIPNGSNTPVTTATFQQNGNLELLNAVRVGTTTDTTDGNIRYTGTEFQGRQGGVWVPFHQVPTSLTATAAVTTTSATYSTVGSMTTTPAAGKYLAHFTCSSSLNVASNTADYAIHIAGTEQLVTRRTQGSAIAAATSQSISISSVITVNGSQVVDVRFRENGSGTLTCNGRELILIPISR